VTVISDRPESSPVPAAAAVLVAVASVVVAAVASVALAHPDAHKKHAAVTKLARRYRVRRDARPVTASSTIDSIVIPLFVFWRLALVSDCRARIA
jgi:hypothetical protein